MFAAMNGLLRAVPTVTAALTSAALLIWVAFGWGYFSVVGPEFVGLASVADYFLTTLKWLPIAAAYGLFIWLASLVRLRFLAAGALSEWGSIARPRTRSRSLRPRQKNSPGDADSAQRA
jgi:hypothetical protein